MLLNTAYRKTGAMNPFAVYNKNCSLNKLAGNVFNMITVKLTNILLLGYVTESVTGMLLGSSKCGFMGNCVYSIFFYKINECFKPSS